MPSAQIARETHWAQGWGQNETDTSSGHFRPGDQPTSKITPESVRQRSFSGPLAKASKVTTAP
jgi:hypothetical protein